MQDDKPQDDIGSTPTSNSKSAHNVEQPKSNQGSLLIDSTCLPSDIRYPIDLSMLNEAREMTERMIDKMHRHVRDVCGFKPRTNHKKARYQFLVVAKQKRLRLDKIKKANAQQLQHLKQDLANMNAFNLCRISHLGASLNRYSKLLVESKLVQ